MDLAIIIYCLVCVVFYLYDGFRIVRNKPELVRKPSWIILTFLVMWLSPVFMPFVGVMVALKKFTEWRVKRETEKLIDAIKKLSNDESAK